MDVVFATCCGTCYFHHSFASLSWPNGQNYYYHILAWGLAELAFEHGPSTIGLEDSSLQNVT